jgi:hypothetical protein
MVMDLELEAWLMRVLSQEDESNNHSRVQDGLIEINVARSERSQTLSTISFASDINGLARAIRLSRHLKELVEPQTAGPQRN